MPKESCPWRQISKARAQFPGELRNNLEGNINGMEVIPLLAGVNTAARIGFYGEQNTVQRRHERTEVQTSGHQNTSGELCQFTSQLPSLFYH